MTRARNSDILGDILDREMRRLERIRRRRRKRSKATREQIKASIAMKELRRMSRSWQKKI